MPRRILLATPFAHAVARFLSAGRPRVFVDYSLVFLICVTDEPRANMSAVLPSYCVASPQEDRTIIMCVSLIGYLMEKHWGRHLESLVKGGKFNEYALATQLLLACVGDLTSLPCRSYLEAACVESLKLGGEVPSWCALVPATTEGAFDTAQHCPFADEGWEGVTEPEASHAVHSTHTCKNLTGRRCGPLDVSMFGFSPQLGRNVSALEACCCPGFEKPYPKTGDDFMEEFSKRSLWDRARDVGYELVTGW